MEERVPKVMKSRTAIAVCSAFVVAVGADKLQADQHQQALLASSDWFGSMVQATIEDAGNSTGCVVPPGIAQDRVNFGTTYRFDNGHPGFVERTAGMIAKPAETAAMQELYAFNVDDLNAEWGEALAAEEIANQNALLTLIYKSEDNYVGVPVEWNSTSQSVITEFLGAGGGGAALDNQALKTYAAHLVAQSIEVTEAEKTKAGIGFTSYIDTEALRAYDCAPAPNATQPEIYLGLSFLPDGWGDLNAQPVTSISGLYDERLGIDYSSWPYKVPD